jgi:hypothetical protein
MGALHSEIGRSMGLDGVVDGPALAVTALKEAGTGS